MDIRTDKSGNIDFESRIQQRRIREVSRYDSKISPERKSEDHLTLSERAIKFKELKGLLEQMSEVRREKVSDLREKIKQGEYEVDSEEVAEEIILEELALSRVL